MYEDVTDAETFQDFPAWNVAGKRHLVVDAEITRQRHQIFLFGAAADYEVLGIRDIRLRKCFYTEMKALPV